MTAQISKKQRFGATMQFPEGLEDSPLNCPGFNTPLRNMIFFFVQINYFNVFMYAYISDNDKQESKVLSNLLKITMNF